MAGKLFINKFFFLIVSLGIIIDQVSKQLVYSLTPHFVSDIVSLTIVYNKGSLFSFLAGTQWANIFFLVFTVIMLVVLVVLTKKYPEHWVPLSLIIAGAIGNGIDRVRFGGVLDFIDFHFFPIFNVADMLLVVGVGIFIWQLVQEEFHK